MNKEIYQFVKECPRCQEHGTQFINEKSYPVSVLVKPFFQIGIDIKHVTIAQSGHKYIIVAIDYLTKYVEARTLLVKHLPKLLPSFMNISQLTMVVPT